MDTDVLYEPICQLADELASLSRAVERLQYGDAAALLELSRRKMGSSLHRPYLAIDIDPVMGRAIDDAVLGDSPRGE